MITIEDVDKRLGEIQEAQNKLTIERFQLLGYRQRITEEKNEKVPEGNKKPGDQVRPESDKSKKG